MRSVWTACLAGWLALALFVLARDLVMVGPQAPGLRRDELAAFLWSMVLWGAISPFIIVLCEAPAAGSGASLAQAMVPALVLQPFVENAVRHGVERHSGATLVSIAGEREGEYLALTVRNSGGAALREQAQPVERQGFGLGLESTRERLAHLDGSDPFALEIATSANVTTARIRIPLAAAA